jgi:hypothetical protein
MFLSRLPYGFFLSTELPTQLASMIRPSPNSIIVIFVPITDRPNETFMALGVLELQPGHLSSANDEKKIGANGKPKAQLPHVWNLSMKTRLKQK